jgi:putative solute:sodium symporter small subunit
MVDLKAYYWRRVKALTVIFLIAWITIAVILPLTAPLLKGVRILGLPSMHWYMNAFIVIVIGVILIFVYSALMDKLDKELKKKVSEEELL